VVLQGLAVMARVVPVVLVGLVTPAGVVVQVDQAVLAVPPAVTGR
jgi:hypothetical protein